MSYIGALVASAEERRARVSRLLPMNRSMETQMLADILKRFLMADADVYVQFGRKELTIDGTVTISENEFKALQIVNPKVYALFGMED